MGIYPIILAGGSGTRLWPLSRRNSAKQFLEVRYGINLLQATVSRIANRDVFFPPTIICNYKQRWQIEDSLRKININEYKLVVEPCSKNTASAITAATLLLGQKDALILVIPVDHCIENKGCFVSAVLSSKAIARKFLVTFGIKYIYPSTAYGYIEKGDKINSSMLYKVSKFIEKPKYKIAKSFSMQRYLWNSGIFLFHPDIYLKEVACYQPRLLYNIKKAIDQTKIEKNVFLLESTNYTKCKNISIDYAIMEKTKIAAVLPSNLNWVDIGKFSSLRQIKDKRRNFIEGYGMFLKSKNCYINSKDLFTSAVGLKDVNIISTKDSVLVVHNDKVEEVREVVRYLEKNDKQDLLNGTIEYRPWGYYESLVEGKGYKIKKIVVNPSGKLSLQSHKYRAEQWTIITGIACVTLNEKVFNLKQGESTYIPVQAKHRLENCQDKLLEIIEIQLGKHLEESDIKRFDDVYGRG